MTGRSRNARIAGLLFIVSSALGMVRLLYIPNTLFSSDDATTRAGNIAAHELMFRFGIVSELLSAALWIFVPLALYRLLKDVDQGLAAVMVILGSLMQVPIFFMNSVADAAALMLARGGEFLAVFDRPQRDAMAMAFLRLHHQGDLSNEIFWGLWLFPFGLLVYRSRFLPRILGVWLMIACFAWLVLSLTGMLFPAYEDRVFKLTQPVALGEMMTMLWLTVMGVQDKRLAKEEA
jgi:hypothetical protein